MASQPTDWSFGRPVPDGDGLSINQAIEQLLPALRASINPNYAGAGDPQADEEARRLLGAFAGAILQIARIQGSR